MFKKPLDPEVALGFLFGFGLLFSVTYLAKHIAIGIVEEKTSFGLGVILATLGYLSTAFGNWLSSLHRRGNVGPAAGVRPISSEVDPESK